MLAPEDRQLLHELLRPPAGYELDAAVGTTYSLDLTTLLTVPLAFTRYQYAEADFEDLDILAVFNAIQQHADKLALFCQAGQIHVPHRQEPVYQLLEEMVIQAESPDEAGSFHPKTWTFRFEAPDGAVRYRFLCSSRNLAFDRSWDTVVTLDGELTDRQYAYARNHPLGDFLEALPRFARRELDDTLADRIEQLQYEVRRVDFEPPAPFESVEFHPFGISRTNHWPFPDRTSPFVVVSPFLTPDILQRFEPDDRSATLVSRLEELERLPPATFEPWDDVYALDEAAAQDVEGFASIEDEQPDESLEAAAPTEDAGTPPLRGLHAKLFHMDRGWDASVWTGSTNATHTGFHQSVEFLVELRGKKSQVGTEYFLEESEDRTTFLDLLTPFEPGEQAEVDEDAEALEDLLESGKQTIIDADPVATVEESGDGKHGMTLRVGGDALALPEEVSARVRPITIAEGFREITGNSAEIAIWEPVSLKALTSFFAFEVRAEHAEKDASTQFVLHVPLEGAPSDRDEHLLRSIIRDERRFIRFLAMLLGDTERGLGFELSQQGWREWSEGREGVGKQDLPVLESLLRVLHRNPDQLDRVHELLADLRATGETEGVVPAAFEAVFEPIWAVREELTE